MTLDIDKIEARANAATPGPWRFDSEDDDIQLANGVAVVDARITSDEDAVFIAAARTDVPALCARVRELEARNANLRQSCEDRGAAMERAEAIAAAERALRKTRERVNFTRMNHDEEGFAVAREEPETHLADLRALGVEP